MDYVVSKKRKMNCVKLELPLGECLGNFNMHTAVCNHGFFMMSPNDWNPITQSLRRPLRLADDSQSVDVTISHPSSNCAFLVIYVHDVQSLQSLPSADQAAILKQVARMLRISNKEEKDMREFQRLHPLAKEKGFGRIFRSPSFFEDAVKSILLCNGGWKKALEMAQNLCEIQRKQNFPTSKEIACLDEKYLRDNCKLGYRAKPILQLAKKIETRKLDKLINKLEDQSSDITSYQESYEKLKKIKGFGDFVCSNIMMCVGYYEKIPSDSETIRHLKMVHHKENCSRKTVKKDVEEIYGMYAPFQCMAYWMELVEEYENRFGKLSELDCSSYHLVTGNGMMNPEN